MCCCRAFDGTSLDRIMELLCASCRRRLVHQSQPSWLRELALRSVSPVASRARALHSSQLLTHAPKVKVQEAVQTEGHSSDLDEPVPAVRTEDEEAIRERYPERELQLEEWREQRLSLMQLPSIYLKLSKYRLTALVVLTSLAGYTMAPAPLEMGTLLWATSGTALCSAAANSINQWIEVPYDSQMARTRNRVLVRQLISSHHAALFGLTTASVGTLILWHMVNPLTAALGLGNILLYSAVYTPMKRISILNTWIGSLVGAMPPLMGWAACTGSLEPGALVLAAILYAWQFAHFNALSWSLRADYSRAGYRMMAVTDPPLCKRVALRYGLAMVPICALAPVFDVTTWWFVLDSLPPNGWLVYLAWRFYRDSDFKSARKLFHFSLFHLPMLMALMLLNKKRWYAEHSHDKTAAATVSDVIAVS